MRYLMRLWRPGLLVVIGFASAASVFAMARRPNGVAPFPVESGHPYADAVTSFSRLKPEERDAVGSSAPDAELSPTGREARREIAAALAAGRDAAPRWRAEHDPLSPGYDPDFLKTLSSLAAVRSAVAQYEGDAAAGDAATLDGLALLLSVGPGLSAEDWKRQQDLIVDGLKRIEARGADRSPAEAAALLAELRALPPPVSFADMIRADPLWKGPGAKLRRALERRARALGFKSDRIDPDVLRMAGLVVEGDRSAVSFEMPAGSFWLEPGQTRYGVALIELDIPGRQARIFFEGREAVVELKSRRIGSWEDTVLEGAIKGLVEESDLTVAAFLEGRDKSRPLSEHLAGLDDFGREADALARDIAEGRVEKSDVEGLTARVARLQAFAPWSGFNGEEFVQNVFEFQAQGEKAGGAWSKTLEELERVAGGGAGMR